MTIFVVVSKSQFGKNEYRVFESENGEINFDDVKVPRFTKNFIKAMMIAGIVYGKKNADAIKIIHTDKVYEKIKKSADTEKVSE